MYATSIEVTQVVHDREWMTTVVDVNATCATTAFIAARPGDNLSNKVSRLGLLSTERNREVVPIP